jgi:hypothetical protein
MISLQDAQDILVSLWMVRLVEVPFRIALRMLRYVSNRIFFRVTNGVVCRFNSVSFKMVSNLLICQIMIYRDGIPSSFLSQYLEFSFGTNWAL